MENPSDATNNRIRVGSKEGKIVWIGDSGYALRANGTPTYCIGISDFLIPDSDGMVDLSLLTLPYAQNYGLGITDLDIKMMWTSCDGDHRFGWKNWNGSHIWGCTRCPGRDPLKKGPVPDGEYVPGEWENQEKRCTICGHRVVKDTTPPVIEGIRNGWRYGLYDTSDGQLGTIGFTARDPEQDKEVSSGIKSVTVNGVEQTGPDYVLTAPETNGENGLSCEIVATDNAGNRSSMRVEPYRYNRVQFFHTRDDPSSRIIELGVLHNGTCKWFYHLPKEAYFIDLDNEDIKIYRGEGDYYNFGVINRNRRFLQVIPKTELPTLELGLRSRRFWGYHADSEGEFIYADMPSRTEKGYRMDIRLTSDEDSYYYGSPESYTLEQLKALDAQGKIKWKKYNTESFLTFDLAPYDEYNGSWYYYAKATNELGTRYVSSSRIIIDADPPVAREYPSGQELAGKIISSNEGTKPTTYWGDLKFTVVDDSEVTVKEKDTILEPDENGVYTLKADFEKYIDRKIIIRDAGGNSATYMNDIRMNTLDRRDNPAPLNLPNGADLGERLPKTVWIMTARDGYLSRIPVIWEIPETYNRALKREQSFTVNGTLDLSGTDIVLHPDRTELGNAQIAVNIAGAPRYKVTIADSENDSVTVVNAAETAKDGTPLFCKDESVMLSVNPDEGYMLSTLSVNGAPDAVAVGDDTYSFDQPEKNVTITATFEKRNEHTVTFDANGGSEPEDLPEEATTAMPDKKVLHGSAYYLPECEFIAPEGKQFKAWEIGGAEYKANAPVTVNADITAKALWEDAYSAPAEYTVTVTDDGNGTASANPTSATVGTEITLTATPNGGYRFKEWKVIIGGVTIADNKLIMPEGNVEVKAVFEAEAPTEFTVTFDGNGGTPTVGSMTTTDGKLASLPNASRADYDFDGWYTEKSGGTKITTDTVFSADATVYAHWSYTGGDGNQGAGGSAFDSGGNVTRGEAAAAIWRMEGSPAPKGRSIFIDVDAKHQYAAPITWAAENGICMGCGDGRFGPNDPITREQLAFTFYRYARYKGYDTTAKGNADTFGDADKIMPYAKPAMQWAAGSGLIQAKFGNRLDPQGTVSRAELTAMRDRFIKKYGLVQGIAPGGFTGWIDPKRLLIPQTGDSGAWGIYGFAFCASLAAGIALITFCLRRRREKAPLQGAEK